MNNPMGLDDGDVAAILAHLDAPKKERRKIWGASWLVPDEAPAAWGARLIVTQTGDVDMLPDRQNAVGDDDAVSVLLGLLNGGVNKAWMATLSAMLKACEVHTRRGREVTLYEDDLIAVRGNTNGSWGYFYVAAWLKEGNE